MCPLNPFQAGCGYSRIGCSFSSRVYPGNGYVQAYTEREGSLRPVPILCDVTRALSCKFPSTTTCPTHAAHLRTVRRELICHEAHCGLFYVWECVRASTSHNTARIQSPPIQTTDLRVTLMVNAQGAQGIVARPAQQIALLSPHGLSVLCLHVLHPPLQ